MALEEDIKKLERIGKIASEQLGSSKEPIIKNDQIIEHIKALLNLYESSKNVQFLIKAFELSAQLDVLTQLETINIRLEETNTHLSAIVKLINIIIKTGW